MISHKVVFVVQNYFDKRDYNRFCIELFRNRGIEVDILNIQAFTRPKSLIGKDKNYYECKNLYIYDNFKSIKNKILTYDNKNTIFLIVIGDGLISQIRILKLLYSKKFIMGSFYLGTIDGNKFKESKIKSNMRKPIKELAKSFIRRIIRLIYNARDVPYNFVLLSGSKSLSMASNHYQEDYTKKIYAHTFDYDTYCKQINSQRLVVDKYAVFIDQYLPSHSDAKAHSINQINGKNYYMKLNNFFDILEKKLNVKIVIATHPRSENNDIIWKGRSYFFGKTANLVKYSEFCLMHTSSAISFCILYEKAILFLSMDEIKKTTHEVIIKNMANELNDQVLYIDRAFSDLQLKENLNLDKNLYSNYKKQFIKYKGEDKQSFDILIDNLEEKGFFKSVKK